MAPVQPEFPTRGPERESSPPRDTSRASLRVLLVEDSPEDAVAVERSLAALDRPRFSLSVEPCCSDAERALAAGPRPDVILLDLNLPDAGGMELVETVVNAAPDVPIVILTGAEQDQTAIQSLHLGAQDYLVKGDIAPQILRRSIRHAIERHEILESLERATRERIEMKNQLLNHVSHELLTPLSAIYQFIDIMRNTIGEQGSGAVAQQQKCLDVLLRNAMQLRRMIGDLMEATRIETGKLALDLSILDPRRPVELALQSAEPEAHRKQIELCGSLSSELPDVLADESRIAQIIANLIANAIKFTPAGGRIHVSAGLHSELPAQVCVSVRDTGCGIRPDALSHVFDRLYQERESTTGSRKGLGLGLYICQEILTQLGGRIWVESEFGAGSCFHFSLPVYRLSELLRDRIDPSRPAALVMLRLGERGVSRGAPEDLLGELHGLLPRLIWGESDCVLPRRKGRDGVEVLGVVARADAEGARAMGDRLEARALELREQLALECPIELLVHPGLGGSGDLDSLCSAIESALQAAHRAAEPPAR